MSLESESQEEVSSSSCFSSLSSGYETLSSQERESISESLDSSEDASPELQPGEDSSESSTETESESEESRLEIGKSSEEHTESSTEESPTEESSTEESLFCQVEDFTKEDFQPPFQEEFGIPPVHCEHCIAENKQNEQVMPRLLSRGQFLLKVDCEGTYQCVRTGLVFEVNKKTDIKYSILSWSKYADLVVKPWIVGGPLFDVKCDPAILVSIQFPHSLCLGYHESSMTFKVFHITKSGPALESTIDHSTTHVKWHVSSLSPVGPVIQTQETVQHHGAVILYKVIDDHPSLSFRVYVATNNDSFIKDIAKAVKHSSKKFMKIDKPPGCLKLLENGKRYRLVSEPEVEINPEEIEFVDGSLLKLKSYIEVFLEQPLEFKLSLVELDSEEIVWKAKLRECDWVQHDQNQNIQKNSSNITRRRKRNDSLSEEDLYRKRKKQTDTSDAPKKDALLDKQLMNLAKKFGKEWIQVAIANLGLEIADIDAIQEKYEDITVCKFRMLKKWQEKERDNATARNLYNCLESDASLEILGILKGFLE
ncbi:NACHT, LRR and PYD domains-containing protein 1a-like [Dromiciops gliroides]|uniref:NACHT, LRR and PYD domains-containing protein 1a-like n=1 Tax=Dromiciops gliroides TaxID=33562 RepID=UPI001CC5B29A|nr:NACHT, LRR and PYD domains-containing protein 1a-like [Dromiciops gliroides]